MPDKYSYKDAKISELGLWVSSINGPEIYLDPGQARALAESIMAQAKPAPRSARTPQRSVLQPAAPTTRRSAPVVPVQSKVPNQITGTVQYVGKSRFSDAQMETRARDLAKQRAIRKLETCMKGLASEGKVWNAPKITEQHFVAKDEVTYVVRADFA